jgi:hypothetical protein
MLSSIQIRSHLRAEMFIIMSQTHTCGIIMAKIYCEKSSLPDIASTKLLRLTNYPSSQGVNPI